MFFILLATVACTTASPDPLPQPARDDRSNSKPAEIPILPSSRNSWSFKPKPTPQSYTSISNTNLEVSSDSGIVRDTLFTKVSFTVTLNHVEVPTAIAGIVEELTIDGGSQIGSINLGLTRLPLLFKGRIDQGRVSIEPTDQSLAGIPCQNPASSIITSIRNLVFLAPSELSKDKTWSDSVSAFGCRGSLPIQGTTVHTYRVVGEVGSLQKREVLIERTDRVSLTGEGAQGQHRILIKGLGSGSGKLHLDPLTGSLVTAENESRTVITVTSSGRSQQFIQVTRHSMRSNDK